MLGLFLRSLRDHCCWWVASLWPGRHSGAPLSLTRFFFLLIGYPLFLAFQFVHWLGFFCDALLFRCYKEINISEPIFILGIPRSGTTFLHRTLATDTETFTSPTTWEVLLAPSITERKFIHLLAAVDRAIGAPLRKLIDWVLRKTAGNLDAIHRVGLNAPEEDYLCLLPIGKCFILLLAFPFAPRLKALGDFASLDVSEQASILNFYKSVLQRQLYGRADKKILSKNAAFSTWGAALKRTFPSAKYLICVREPETAMSSQLSSIEAARRLFGTDPEGTATARLIGDCFESGYREIAHFLEQCDENEVALLAQTDLRQDPSGTITSALQQLDLDPGEALRAQLRSLRPASQSGHSHHPDNFPINQSKIHDCMVPDYEAILRSPNRSQPSSQK